MGYTTITPGGTTLILPISPNLTALYPIYIIPKTGTAMRMPEIIQFVIQTREDTSLKMK